MLDLRLGEGGVFFFCGGVVLAGLIQAGPVRGFGILHVHAHVSSEGSRVRVYVYMYPHLAPACLPIYLSIRIHTYIRIQRLTNA